MLELPCLYTWRRRCVVWLVHATCCYASLLVTAQTLKSMLVAWYNVHQWHMYDCQTIWIIAVGVFESYGVVHLETARLWLRDKFTTLPEHLKGLLLSDICCAHAVDAFCPTISYLDHQPLFPPFLPATMHRWMLDPLAGPLVAQFSSSVVRRLQLFSHGFPTLRFFSGSWFSLSSMIIFADSPCIVFGLLMLSTGCLTTIHV